MGSTAKVCAEALPVRAALASNPAVRVLRSRSAIAAPGNFLPLTITLMTGKNFPVKRMEQMALSRREREIMDVLFALGEGDVEDVRSRLADTPGYDSVRTT